MTHIPINKKHDFVIELRRNGETFETIDFHGTKPCAVSSARRLAAEKSAGFAIKKKRPK